MPSRDAVAHLMAASGIPRAEGLRLLALATGWTREQLVAHPERSVGAAGVTAFEALTRQRREGAPIAYLIGHREFYGRDFEVSPSVLIPRPETELLVDLALQRLLPSPEGSAGMRVLDLGTGSGAIAVTLALERPSAEVVASDVSALALECARTNADRLGANVRFVKGDWFTALDRTDRFELIVSNPPYIAATDPHLGSGDLRFEPAGALTDFADGLSALRRIIAEASCWLCVDGVLMLEHGHDQAVQVRRAMADAGYTDLFTARDLAGIERVTCGAVGAMPNETLVL